MALLSFLQFHQPGNENSNFIRYAARQMLKIDPGLGASKSEHKIHFCHSESFCKLWKSFLQRLTQQKQRLQWHCTSVPDPDPGESTFLFFLGPMAANAVRLASLCLICASSCCCIWIGQNKYSSLFFFQFPKQEFILRWTLTSFAFCFNLSCSGSSCRDRDYVDKGWTQKSWRERKKN